MRVLHVNKFLYRRGGAEAYMEDVASHQAAAGHEVQFFGMEHPSNTHLGLSHHFPPRMDMEPAPPGLLDKARVAGRVIWSTSAQRGMQGALAEFRPDLVHFHNVYHQLSPSVVAAARRAGVATVMTLHDYKLACPNYLFQDTKGLCEACVGGHWTQPVRRRCKGGSLTASALLTVEATLHHGLGAYGGIDRFVCPSRFLHDKMVESGIYPERLRVVPNFVDVPPGPPWPGPGGPLVFAGRLERYKGTHVLLDAMALLPDPVTLDIVGDGPEREKLEAQAAQVAPGRVRFHGRLQKAEVARLIGGASMLVAPSLWYENQPLVVLEAMSTGVPVVGSALGGFPELLGPTGAGLLAAPGDPEALAAAVRQLLADPAAARAAGAAGSLEARERYSVDVHLSQLDAVYGEALSAHPAGGPVTP